MKGELTARFERRFPGGMAVCAHWTRPLAPAGVTVLFGPSGCGKTTVLRCLAGLDRPQQGCIEYGNEIWFDADRRVCRPPQQRDIGFLFQEYALFPHLTVETNVSFGLRALAADQRRQRVGEILDRLQLTGLERRYPHQISGGQQQRVALARALVRRPQLMLLDEPLSALDGPTREEVRPALRQWLLAGGVPVVLVTHDRTEAMALGDHLVVMEGGRICQDAPVDEVFSRPANSAVARIVGMETVCLGHILSVEDGLATVRAGTAQLVALAPAATASAVYVCIRGEEVSLLRAAPGGSPRNHLPAVVQTLTPEGPLVRVALDAGFPLTALVTRPACRELDLQPGQRLTAVIKAPAVHLIARPAEPAVAPAAGGE